MSPALSGKLGIVFGVANKRSIAWAIAQAWHKAGARLAFTYQGERLKENVEELAGTFGPDTLLMPCDVTRDEDIARVFAEVCDHHGGTRTGDAVRGEAREREARGGELGNCRDGGVLRRPRHFQ